MGLASLPYSLTNGSTADAAQVMADLIALRDAINSVDASNIVDGSVTLAELATAVKNNFTKLATPADHKEAFGVYGSGSVGSWGSTNTVAGSIPHGLGATPTVVDLQPTAGDTGTEDIRAMFVSADGTNINFRLYSGRTLNLPGVAVHWRAVV